MTEVEAILKSGKSSRDESVAPVLEQEIREAEAVLGIAFPASYCEFMELGGLDELRFTHRILRPSEVVEAKRYTGAAPIVPFADDGCGGLFGWADSAEVEPTVVMWDHEESSLVQVAPSFTVWLARARF
ncbi:MAG: SMI1/KNR4 family protein [Comamonadaceae bacterium]|nr:MAG: SMI1/KNR4 family protein [Comamonadaceae bacterium]